VQDTISFIKNIGEGNFRSIAQAITLVENNLDGSSELLLQLHSNPTTKVVGVTGPPGAGKSTLINALLSSLVKQNKKIAVLSIDPSSPFNYGALLGDRIRMSEFYLNPNVYIRSLASRGSLGGLNATIIEILDVLKSSVFDYILIETVGVGQSEVEIAGIADTTIVVMVPEAGDEVQTMKAGVMEIADIFVVNKSDRANADEFVKNLKYLAHSKANEWEVPVVKCIATEYIGIDELLEKIESHHNYASLNTTKKAAMLTEKAYQLIQHKRMIDIQKDELTNKIQLLINQNQFHLYQFVKSFQ
jgi:LAO/AO transport system kinase